MEKQNRELLNWSNVIKHIADLEKSKENLASEVISDCQKKGDVCFAAIIVLVLWVIWTNALLFCSLRLIGKKG